MSGPLARAQALVAANYGTPRGWVRYLLGQWDGIAGPPARFRQLQPAAIRRLVFVCLGNINRSAFACAVAGREAVSCCSIGLSTTSGAPATPEAIATAAELGYALDSHQATNLADFEAGEGDLYVVMELRHAQRLAARGIPAGNIVLLGHWARPLRYHIHDPHTLSREYFRSCFAVIQPAVLHLIRELRLAASPCTRR